MSAVAVMVLVIAVVAQRTQRAFTAFDNHPSTPTDRWRTDSNGGHTTIDFAGQWIMGRIVATDDPRRLYDRTTQRRLIRAAFPVADTSPWVRANNFPKRPGVVNYSEDDPLTDEEWLMYAFMGTDSPAWREASVGFGSVLAGIGSVHPFTAAALVDQGKLAFTPALLDHVTAPRTGGPLYPPIHGLLMAPLGRIDEPRRAYRALQLAGLFAAVVLAGALSRLAPDGPHPMVLFAVVLLFTGTRGSLELAQNALFTAAIVATGWALLADGREKLGGAVWGLLAFKPTWGLAFVLVPLVFGRWRFVATMVLTGGGLVVLTIPVVGVSCWWDWLDVGREAAETYRLNKNWVFLSRDLFGLPRRVLIDFQKPLPVREVPLAGLIGWGIWVFVVGSTMLLVLRCRHREPRGEVAGFVAGYAFLGAYLGCYRFMYYDAVIAIVPMVLLVATRGPGNRLAWCGLIALLLWENWLVQACYPILGTPLDTGYRYPWDTLILLGVWVGTTVRLLTAGRTTSALPIRVPPGR